MRRPAEDLLLATPTCHSYLPLLRATPRAIPTCHSYFLLPRRRTKDLEQLGDAIVSLRLVYEAVEDRVDRLADVGTVGHELPCESGNGGSD